MNNGIISPEIIEKLTNIVGSDFIFIDDETRQKYGHDETEDYNFPPAVLIKLAPF